jgi:hypothetical protein
MFNPRCVPFAIGLLVLASQCDCARSRAQTQRATQACAILAQSMANQENTFVARAQAIRGTHILLRDYDRQMIALLEERRTAIRARLLTDSSADEGVAGCSGQQLDDLRKEVLQEMNRLQGFLNTFRRALQEDPAGVFIDAR